MLIFLFCTSLLISLKAASQLSYRANGDTAVKKNSLQILPQNFYIKNLGFVCKKEFQLQKLISIPVFFRLGTKEYVDRLERKPNSFVGRRE